MEGLKLTESETKLKKLEVIDQLKIKLHKSETKDQSGKAAANFNADN
jgi:hypothetical protein